MTFHSAATTEFVTPLGAVDPNSSVQFRTRLAVLRRIALGCLLLVLSASLCLSLISWSVVDPSLTLASSAGPRNIMGPLGAISSDLTIQLVGLASAALPLPIAYWGLQLLTTRRVAEPRLKLVLLPISVILLAGALSALPTMAGWPLRHGYGGLAGDFLHTQLTGFLKPINSMRAGSAAGIALFAIGLSVFIRSIGLTGRDLKQIFARNPASVPAMGNQTPPEAMPPLSSGLPSRTFAKQNHHAPEPSHHNLAAAVVSPMPQTMVAQPVHSAHRATPDRLASPSPLPPRLQYPGACLTQATVYPNPFLRAHPMTAAMTAGQQSQAPTPHRLPPQPPLAQSFVPHTGTGPAPVPPVAAPRPHFAPPPVPHDSTAPHNPVPVTTAYHPQGSPAFPRSPSDTRFIPAQPDKTTRLQTHARHPQLIDSERAAGDADEFDLDADSRAIAARFAPRDGLAIAAPTNSNIAGQTEPPSEKPLAPDWRSGQRPQPVQTSAATASLMIRRADSVHPPHAFTVRQPSPSFSLSELLHSAPPRRPGPELGTQALRGLAKLLLDTLSDYGVKGEITAIRPGPVVTLFEFEPARGTKTSRVVGLADDIARTMSATAVRIAVIAGRNAIGIELPNVSRDKVFLRELIESSAFSAPGIRLPLALGKTISGDPVVADLARMPHLLVAGTTGSGKSVGVNAMILSLLTRLSPEQCRFLMIDPKMLELSVYNHIPHLLTPVVTEPAKAVSALEWAVREMEDRYKAMSRVGVRNVEAFNERIGRDTASPAIALTDSADTLMPYIVIVIDEFADLMAIAGKEIELTVQRLAQMARAAGIHLIMATQRPSVDVITGTIKANFPTRISFRVTSRIDSRTILNEHGAEQLLGQGDMLFASGSGAIMRVHGPFVSDEEVDAVAATLRSRGSPRYSLDLERNDAAVSGTDLENSGPNEEDDLYDRAVAIVVRDGKASTSYLQRRLSIGYNRAAGLIERMESDGLISPANHVGKREILSTPASESR